MFICEAQPEKTTNSRSLVNSLLCVHLSPLYCFLQLFFTTFSQMRRLNSSNHFDLTENYLPSTVVAMGFVSMVDTTDNCFSVSLSQNIATDAPVGTLTMHSISTSEPNLLPILNETIAFTGELLTVLHTIPVFHVNRFHNIVNGLPQPPLL